MRMAFMKLQVLCFVHYLVCFILEIVACQIIWEGKEQICKENAAIENPLYLFLQFGGVAAVSDGLYVLLGLLLFMLYDNIYNILYNVVMFLCCEAGSLILVLQNVKWGEKYQDTLKAAGITLTIAGLMHILNAILICVFTNDHEEIDTFAEPQMHTESHTAPRKGWSFRGKKLGAPVSQTVEPAPPAKSTSQAKINEPTPPTPPTKSTSKIKTTSPTPSVERVPPPKEPSPAEQAPQAPPDPPRPSLLLTSIFAPIFRQSISREPVEEPVEEDPQPSTSKKQSTQERRSR